MSNDFCPVNELRIEGIDGEDTLSLTRNPDDSLKIDIYEDKERKASFWITEGVGMRVFISWLLANFGNGE